MNHRILENQWGYSLGRFVFKFHRDFKEHPRADSRLTFDPNKGVGEIYINFRLPFPLDTDTAQTEISRSLRKFLNADRYICVIEGNNKVKGEDLFYVNIQFHFRAKDKPEDASSIPEIMESAFQPRLFRKIDRITGESELIEYFELPDKPYRNKIVQYCEDPKPTESLKKRPSFKGYYYEFA